MAQIAQRGNPYGTAEPSERETEVLQGMAKGPSNKEISGRCEISVKMVETYKARAMEKLGLRNRAELVRYAAENGWLAERQSVIVGGGIAGDVSHALRR